MEGCAGIALSKLGQCEKHLFLSALCMCDAAVNRRWLTCFGHSPLQDRLISEHLRRPSEAQRRRLYARPWLPTCGHPEKLLDVPISSRLDSAPTPWQNRSARIIRPLLVESVPWPLRGQVFAWASRAGFGPPALSCSACLFFPPLPIGITVLRHRRRGLALQPGRQPGTLAPPAAGNVIVGS